MAGGGGGGGGAGREGKANSGTPAADLASPPADLA